ncbi:hypothetical protein H5410_009258 [Solanum commersonii]|uniref:Uncharacterized protein n=1 Tax=Solanum commersonii TaxID=4109 RepID=A0A9J6AHH3_SOLCO|nr:hypothetical protein H5410_009258 [Solanum commersonii]
MELKLLMFLKFYPSAVFLGYRTEGDSIGKCRCHKGLNMYSKLHNDHLWQTNSGAAGDCPLNFGFRPTPDALENLIDTLLSQKVFIFPEF